MNHFRLIGNIRLEDCLQTELELYAHPHRWSHELVYNEPCLRLCVRVCLCFCMCVCWYVCWAHACACVRQLPRAYVCVSACGVGLCACVRVCLSVCVCFCMCACARLCVCVRTCLLCVCVFVCMCARAHTHTLIESAFSQFKACCAEVISRFFQTITNK